jgi:hypothetical protein
LVSKAAKKKKKDEEKMYNNKEKRGRREAGKSSPPSPMPTPEAWRWTVTKTHSGFAPRGWESNPQPLSIYDEAASDLPPIPLSQTPGVLCSLGGGG